MSKLKYFWLSLLVFSLASALAEAQGIKPSPYKTGPLFQNISNLTQIFNFSPYFYRTPQHRVKMAIFDNGFAGYQSAVGQTLPQDTVYEQLPLNDDNTDDHGFYVAEMVQALMTNDGRASQFTPELHLYNVSSYTNFKAAIDDCIKKYMDIILFPDVKEFGGNLDGQGIWNTQVNRATAAGIIWVNSAGNFSKNTFNAPINNDTWVSLPDKNNTLGFHCYQIQCHVNITLAWNDFKNVTDVGTNKDLDFAVLDSSMILKQRSELHQVMDPSLVKPRNGNSLLPRETIETDLPQGQYYIQVKNQSMNFTAHDSLRILMDGAQLDHYDDAENILSPADNPTVITVGASDSPISDVSVRLHKPELLASSALYINNGNIMKGSTNAAAFVAAGFGILKSLDPLLDRKALLAYTASPQSTVIFSNGPVNDVGLKLSDLGFLGQGPGGCFGFYSPDEVNVPNYLTVPNALGVTATTKGIKIMVGFDPVILAPNQIRQNPNDAIVGTPDGFVIMSRSAAQNLPQADAEVFQQPTDGSLCDGKGPPKPIGSIFNRSFWLPRLN